MGGSIGLQLGMILVRLVINYLLFLFEREMTPYITGRLIPVFVRYSWHKTNNLYGFTHLIIMNYIKLNNYLTFTFLTKI